MDVVFARCAGLDGHQKTLVAWVWIRTETETLETIHTVATTTEDLRRLSAWLATQGVTHVAMESTGSDWNPIFNLLEEHFTTWLVNPAHIQAVPGRKSDVKDSAWIAQWLQPSFIPDRAERELRERIRYRKSLIEERARSQRDSAGVRRGEPPARVGD